MLFFEYLLLPCSFSWIEAMLFFLYLLGLLPFSFFIGLLPCSFSWIAAVLFFSDCCSVFSLDFCCSLILVSYWVRLNDMRCAIVLGFMLCSLHYCCRHNARFTLLLCHFPHFSCYLFSCILDTLFSFNNSELLFSD